MSRHGKLFLLALSAVVVFATDAIAAKTAAQVFREASPSVVLVEVSDRNGKVIATGSGVVVVVLEQVITNCHVVNSGEAISISYRGKHFPAQLEVANARLDLCGLIVPGLTAPPVRISPLQSLVVGARVFAIGAPKGLELSISDGIVSSIRQHEGKPIIQTTTPISPGSSGGGLFDDQARLVGITTFFLVDGQNLNFAVPAELVATLSQPSESRVSSQEEDKARSASLLGTIMRLLEGQKYSEANRIAAEWTERQPYDPIAWAALGQAYEKQKILTRAIEAYKKAIQLDSSFTAAWVGLGDSYLAIKRIDQARQAYEEALLTNAQYSSAYVGLAKIEWEQDNLIGALSLFEKAVRISFDQGFPDRLALVGFCSMASILQLQEMQDECKRLWPEVARLEQAACEKLTESQAACDELRENLKQRK